MLAGEFTSLTMKPFFRWIFMAWFQHKIQIKYKAPPVRSMTVSQLYPINGGCISIGGMRVQTRRPSGVVPKKEPVAVLSVLMTWYEL